MAGGASSLQQTRSRVDMYGSEKEVTQSQAIIFLEKKFGLELDEEFMAALWEEEELQASDKMDRARLLVIFSQELDPDGTAISGAEAQELAMTETDQIMRKRRQATMKSLDGSLAAKAGIHTPRAVTRLQSILRDHQESPAQLFTRFDADCDGYISRSELQSVTAGLTPVPLTESEVDSMMAFVDTDQKGMISFGNFCVFAERPPGLLTWPTPGMTLEAAEDGDSEVEHTALNARRTPDGNRTEWPEDDDNDARLQIRRSPSSESLNSQESWGSAVEDWDDIDDIDDDDDEEGMPTEQPGRISGSAARMAPSMGTLLLQSAHDVMKWAQISGI